MKLKAWFEDKNKKTVLNVVMVFIIGLLLLALSSGILIKDKGENTLFSPSAAEAQLTQTKTSSYETELEKRLEEALKQAAGVGDVKVMINISTGKEIVVAEDLLIDESGTKEQDSQGGTREQSSKRTENEHIIINERDGTQTPLVLKEIQPKIEGLIIIAKGGDDVYVKDALIRAAQALFAIEANKVTVMKMK